MADDRERPTMKLRILLPNGVPITAPILEWVAAILLEMPEESRKRVYERIQKKHVFYETPGSHILNAEGANFLVTRGDNKS